MWIFHVHSRIKLLGFCTRENTFTVDKSTNLQLLVLQPLIFLALNTSWHWWKVEFAHSRMSRATEWPKIRISLNLQEIVETLHWKFQSSQRKVPAECQKFKRVGGQVLVGLLSLRRWCLGSWERWRWISHIDQMNNMPGFEKGGFRNGVGIGSTHSRIVRVRSGPRRLENCKCYSTI